MKLQLSLLALLGFTLLLTSPLSAQATTPSAKKLPFHGKLDSFTSNSITVGKKETVYQLDANTVFIDGAGNPTSFSSAVAGESVSGSYLKSADGTRTLCKLRLGSKTGTDSTSSSTSTPVAASTPVSAPATASAAPVDATTTTTTKTVKVKKSSFTGTVTSVGALSNSIALHGKEDRTFTVDPSAKLTDSTGATTTLGTIAVGAKVTVSYAKNTDGSYTLYTLKEKASK